MSKFDFLPLKKAPCLIIVVVMSFLAACNPDEKDLKPICMKAVFALL